MIKDVRLQIRELAAPVAQKLGIGKISDFADVILLSFLFFTTVHNSLSPAVSGVLFPVSYGKAGKRARNNWWGWLHYASWAGNNVQIQGYTCGIACPCHFDHIPCRTLSQSSEPWTKSRLWVARRCRVLNSYRDGVGRLWANANTVFWLHSSYFIWDTLESIIHFSDTGFVFHGTCLASFFAGLLLTSPQAFRVFWYTAFHLWVIWSWQSFME